MRTYGEKFGDLIRRYRESLGLDAGELAEEVWGDKTRRSRISELENGRVIKPHAKTVDALAVYLNIPQPELDECRKRDPEPEITIEVEALKAYAEQLKKQVQDKEAEIRKLQKENSEENENEVRKVQEEVNRLRSKSIDPKAALIQQRKNFDRIVDLFRREGNQIEGPKIADAEEAMKKGDLSLADQLLEEISAREQLAVERSARAFYARGEIAEEQVRWAEAAALYRRAAELDDRFWHLKKAHEFTHWSGEYRAALPLAVRAKNKAFQEFGKETEEYALSINDLGITLGNLGQLRKAIPLLKEALKLRQKILKKPHKDIGTSLNNLASLYESQGKYEAAEPLFLQAMEIRKEAQGEAHPDYAQSLNNLAALYQEQDKYEAAEPLFLRAMEITKDTLGEAHPDYATSLNNLAGMYQAQGKYEGAEPLLLQAIEIGKETLGEAHPDYAASLNNLAGLYYAQGKYQDAEPLYLQAMEIRKETLGEAHPDYAASLNNLAGLYYTQGKYQDAEPLFQQAIKILEAALGADHPNTQTLKANYEIFKSKRK